MQQSAATHPGKALTSLAKITPLCKSKLTVIFCIAILLIVNYPLFFGNVRSQLIFFPGDVLAGHWWQFFTHPLVHLSWYHLILDGLAFILLFLLLEEERFLARLWLSLGAGAGALTLGLLLEPAIYSHGLCGLSGIAHGLMAISAAEIFLSKRQRGLGLFCLSVVITKCVYELYSGHVVLESLHMGQTGEPLTASHAGGVIGGLLAYASQKIIPPETIGKNKDI